MEIIRSLDDLHLTGPSAVTIGKFDGLHLGHQLLLDDLKASGLYTIVVALVMGDEFLMTYAERIRKLEAYGIDCLIELPIADVAELSAGTFLHKILIERLGMSLLSVGPDFRFGHGAAGDVAYLTSQADAFALHVIPKRTYNGEIISSTYIRERLKAGDLAQVNGMLGYSYSFTGTVRHGSSIGHTLGVPTVNIIPESGKCLPPFGVYVSSILLPDGTREYGMCNLGVRPTVSEEKKAVLEMNIFWFEGDLYGSEVTIELLDYMRPERKFESRDTLKEQLVMDELFAKFYFKTADFT